MSGRTRVRNIPYHWGPVGKTRTYDPLNTDKVISVISPEATFSGFQKVVDNKHAWPPSRQVRELGLDVGGVAQFTTGKLILMPAYVTTRSANKVREYEGYLYPSGSRIITPATSGQPTIPTLILSAMGTEGWAKFKPTAPQAGLSQFLGELRDIPRLPMLLMNLRRAIRRLDVSTAGDYLNYEFAWRPLISDMRRFASTALHYDARLRQLIRDNGKWVRRKGLIASTSSTTAEATSGGSYVYPSPHSSLHDGPQTQLISTTTEEDYRFSGRFRYYIPTGNTPEMQRHRREQLARILGGAEVNGRLLYELMPWSWLADWFTNLGAVVSNITDIQQDSLAASWAYVTGVKRVTKTTQVTGRLIKHGAFDSKITEIRETKIRTRAGPYGFGWTWLVATPRQLAILAALGITRT